MESLEFLLDIVDNMFPTKPETEIPIFSYSLNRTQHGYWRFTVTDCWQKWSDNNLDHQFGEYRTPAEAVDAFLDYVKENDVDVKSLAGAQ